MESDPVGNQISLVVAQSPAAVAWQRNRAREEEEQPNCSIDAATLGAHHNFSDGVIGWGFVSSESGTSATAVSFERGAPVFARSDTGDEGVFRQPQIEEERSKIPTR